MNGKEFKALNLVHSFADREFDNYENFGYIGDKHDAGKFSDIEEALELMPTSPSRLRNLRRYSKRGGWLPRHRTGGTGR